MGVLERMSWRAVDRRLREATPKADGPGGPADHPFSVLAHAELIRLPAGNAVVAETPAQGGAFGLAAEHAVMAPSGLPVTQGPRASSCSAIFRVVDDVRPSGARALSTGRGRAFLGGTAIGTGEFSPRRDGR